jgi:hypothetical protein
LLISLGEDGLRRWSRVEEGYDVLPGPQAEALRVAFGQTPGGGANPFLVGLASLIAELSPDRPLLLLQQMSGNGTLIARITSQTDTSSNAKAGITWKQSTSWGRRTSPSPTLAAAG